MKVANSMKEEGYDVISDVHGYAVTLEKLLIALGYQEQNGVFSHPQRKAVFVGDIINRGPHILYALEMVYRMHRAGSALVVLGNHELSALRTWQSDGMILRPTVTAKQLHRGHSTREQVADSYPELWRTYLTWIRTLPLALDLGGLRVVHACWDAESVEKLELGKMVPTEALVETKHPKTPLTCAVETLVSGPELSWEATDGTLQKIRTKWWVDPHQKPLRDAILPKNPKQQIVSDQRLDATQETYYRPYASTECPVIFGHYAKEDHPLPYQSNLACIDTAVARGGGLCAYRWSGESSLKEENFVRVPTQG